MAQWWDELGYWPRTYAYVGTGAFVLCAMLMPVAIRLMHRFGLLDPVQEGKIHQRPVPRGAGVIMWIAFAAAVLAPGYRSDAMNGVLLGSFLCMLTGAVDDFVTRIPGFYKLGVLFLVTLILSWYGVRTSLFQVVWLDTLLTLLWIAGVTSAFNGADNMDGAAGGIAGLACFFFFLIALQAELGSRYETTLAWFGMMAIALAGVCAAFLLFNWKPARVFMGDSGSLFLGYMLAALSVMGEWTEHALLSAIIPILLLGVPLFDFAYVLLTRIIRGETRSLRSIVDHCAPDHLSHRLVLMGFSQRKAVLFIYLFCFALGTTGVLIRNSTSIMDAVLSLLQGGVTLAMIIALMTAADIRQRSWLKDEVERTAREGGPS
jgi:UDP-GlcNAc:undecaprenyl-phosphate GlcNAc-1-phosphate transferase